jgi:hypothetical protein
MNAEELHRLEQRARLTAQCAAVASEARNAGMLAAFDDGMS